MTETPTRHLGELAVSAQGLGCMGMSHAYGATDDEQSIATLHHALDLGVTLLDTADFYGAGHNEELIGRAIAGRRDEVVVATKFGFANRLGEPTRVRGDAAYVRQACDASLRRLVSTARRGIGGRGLRASGGRATIAEEIPCASERLGGHDTSRRSARPANAPVGRPSRSAAVPFTRTCRMPRA